MPAKRKRLTDGQDVDAPADSSAASSSSSSSLSGSAPDSKLLVVDDAEALKRFKHEAEMRNNYMPIHVIGFCDLLASRALPSINNQYYNGKPAAGQAPGFRQRAIAGVAALLLPYYLHCPACFSSSVTDMAHTLAPSGMSHLWPRRKCDKGHAWWPSEAAFVQCDAAEWIESIHERERLFWGQYYDEGMRRVAIAYGERAGTCIDALVKQKVALDKYLARLQTGTFKRMAEVMSDTKVAKKPTDKPAPKPTDKPAPKSAATSILVPMPPLLPITSSVSGESIR